MKSVLLSTFLFFLALNTNASIEFQLESELASKMSTELSKLLGNGESYVVRVDLKRKELSENAYQYVQLPLGAGQVKIPREGAPTQAIIDFPIQSAHIQVFVNQELTQESTQWIKNYLQKHPSVSEAQTRVDVLFNIPKAVVKDEVKVEPLEEPNRAPSSLQNSEEKELSTIKSALKKMGLNTVTDNEVVALFNLFSSILIVAGLILMSFLAFTIATFIRSKKKTGPNPPPIPLSSSLASSSTESALPPPVPLDSIHQTWNDRDMWSKFTKESLILGLNDLASDDTHSENIPKLLSQFVPSELYKQIESEFEGFYFSGKGTKDLSETVIKLMNNLSEYNRLANDDISLKCLRLSNQTLKNTIIELQAVEMIALFSRMSPVKKDSVTHVLPTEAKLKIMKLDSSQITDDVYSKALEKVKRIINSLDHDFDKSNEQLEQITHEIARASTFPEDELFYHSSDNYYQSPLHFLDHVQLKGISLKTLALCYHGYSEEVIEELMENFDEDSRNWLSSFIEQYNAELLGWDHPSVKRAREEVLSLKESPVELKLAS